MCCLFDYNRYYLLKGTTGMHQAFTPEYKMLVLSDCSQTVGDVGVSTHQPSPRKKRAGRGWEHDGFRRWRLMCSIAALHDEQRSLRRSIPTVRQTSSKEPYLQQLWREGKSCYWLRLVCTNSLVVLSCSVKLGSHSIIAPVVLTIHSVLPLLLSHIVVSLRPYACTIYIPSAHRLTKGGRQRNSGCFSRVDSTVHAVRPCCAVHARQSNPCPPQKTHRIDVP